MDLMSNSLSDKLQNLFSSVSCRGYALGDFYQTNLLPEKTVNNS